VSNKKISDEAIVDAAKLLRKGAKMLSYYCPECHFPLFQSEGKIFCPNCNREVVIEEKVEKKEETKQKIESPSLMSAIESAAIKICELIVSSRSAEEIRVLAESLDRILGSMEKLRKFQ